MTINEAFQWQRQPKAEQLLQNILQNYINSNSFIDHLQHRLLKHTSTRLLDWVEYLAIEKSPELEKELQDSGFVQQHASSTFRLFYHPGAQLPRILVWDNPKQSTNGVAITVDRIENFLMVHGLSAWIEGGIYSQLRRCCITTENNIALWLLERRGVDSIEPTYPDPGYLERYFEAIEKWKTRPRDLDDENEAFIQTLAIADEIVRLLGEDLAACVVLEVEREYWQSRNTAGQIQKARQDRLGMGWANHDHHTFRSSRKHFQKLVRLFEMLGFHCRERFYAGEEAGWGAQVMENPRSKLVLFLDVDLAPHELAIDFSHQPLPELEKLGTIGLWCALHGDSILKAGMHHLEAQFQFEELTEDLKQSNVQMMEPFSNFPYLKQAFTEGEMWHVDPKRIEVLVRNGKLSHEQADKFLKQGALGSHMENLQRREGYKGFNQKNVSFIIKKTDPRALEVH